VALEPVQFVLQDDGEAGLLVEILGPDDEARWAGAQGLARALRHRQDRAIVDVVATYRHVFISFDPLCADATAIQTTIRELAGALPARDETRDFDVPVVYGGDFGPDLQSVAEELATTPAALVDEHTSAPWTVRFIASPAAAPFMDRPAAPGPVRRLASPRPRVAPGSVAISGRQCMIYGGPSPGGWRIIGRTPARLHDLERDPPVAYRPGDRFRFVPIAASDWEQAGCELR
jgi:KipI family sensor histidine kinase inhibitor